MYPQPTCEAHSRSYYMRPRYWHSDSYTLSRPCILQWQQTSRQQEQQQCVPTVVCVCVCVCFTVYLNHNTPSEPWCHLQTGNQLSIFERSPLCPALVPLQVASYFGGGGLRGCDGVAVGPRSGRIPPTPTPVIMFATNRFTLTGGELTARLHHGVFRLWPVKISIGPRRI